MVKPVLGDLELECELEVDLLEAEEGEELQRDVHPDGPEAADWAPLERGDGLLVGFGHHLQNSISSLKLYRALQLTSI